MERSTEFKPSQTDWFFFFQSKMLVNKKPKLSMSILCDWVKILSKNGHKVVILVSKFSVVGLPPYGRVLGHMLHSRSNHSSPDWLANQSCFSKWSQVGTRRRKRAPSTLDMFAENVWGEKWSVNSHQGSSNNWLRVVPRTQFGSFARGATVTAFTRRSGVHTRIIDGGSGYLCEMEPVAHFGLGNRRRQKWKTRLLRSEWRWVDFVCLFLNPCGSQEATRWRCWRCPGPTAASSPGPFVLARWTRWWRCSIPQGQSWHRWPMTPRYLANRLSKQSSFHRTLCSWTWTTWR